MKLCPFCAEQIQDAAIVCKHCKRDLPAAPEPLASSKPASDRAETAPKGAEVSAQPPATGRGNFGILATVVGFVMTIASASTVGLGILLIWFGLAYALPGPRIVRWGGGFFLALVVGVLGMGMAGTGPRPSNAPTSGTGYRQTCTTADGKDCSPGAVSNAAPRYAPSAPPARPAPSAYDLALLSARGYESEYGGYHYVEGRVKNVSDRPIENVTAIASWFDKSGEFIKADEALIDYNPILPGQISTFKTISSGNPAMSRYSVEFKTLLGGSLLVEDQRKRKK